MNTEEIITIIAEEIASWKQKEFEADDSEKYKYHGAMCELMRLSGRPDQITTEYLREQWKESRRRSKVSEIENRELDLIARNRAVKACDAIAVLAKRISALDTNSKKQ